MNPSPVKESAPDAGTRDAPADVPVPPAERHLTLAPLCVLGILVGVIGGLGAVVFRALIGAVHNLLFLGDLSFVYEARVFTPPSPWGAAIILVPVLGSLGVTFLVTTFAPEARGHGVPEVIDATYYNRGIIRPVVAVVKSLASALAIGSGAAVGREGPIIQIGSAFGSILGQILRMQPGQRVTLVAAGAGAGIAATFNTPIGGVMFAIELMLPEVSVATFLPVALATGTATYVAQLFFGNEPAFSVPAHIVALAHPANAGLTLLLYGLLGCLTGVVAAAFILGLHRMELLFDRIGSPYLRHALGMLCVGVMMYGFLVASGHYFVEGVGYSTIQRILEDGLGGVGFLLLLCGAKLLATLLSLGSGSSGGVFSPSLFMGATLGAALSVALGAVHTSADLQAFAIVGMGAMVGGTTGAAMTAVTMIFEMTRDYAIVLPMIIAVTLSIAVRRVFSPETIYTLKLRLRNHPVPSAMQANVLLLRTAAELIDRQARVVSVDEAGGGVDPRRAAADVAGTREGDVVLTRDGSVVGVRRLARPRSAAAAAAAADAPDQGATGFEVRDHDTLKACDFFVVPPDASAAVVIERLRGSPSMVGVVKDAEEGILGLVTKDSVLDCWAESNAVFPR